MEELLIELKQRGFYHYEESETLEIKEHKLLALVETAVVMGDRSIRSISSRCYTCKLPKLFAEMAIEKD
ncbi:MAG: hypothetical protein JGK21_24795 [Microcoleus sp. PH2017_22_RUC_O_B]|uniref:hypothetical protein n=1 Tax=unclassified Microcoleus TaxID=2642155 RepID=UPI001D4EC5EE|nr:MULTISPECIES: hypothetical protein [unclassified Microcoleus]MCC3531202.1 hypothetical protein [Microcoleus sp. PH2017_21_RUC_O_A]MCC3543509.1 hypothetical protein [Microcoleus sp. PH2017_22_RUC_O_B]